MSRLTDQRISETRARLEAATPGPWSAADEHGLMPGATPAWCISRVTPDGGYVYDVADIPQGGDPSQEQADAELIAHAPIDLADLLAEREQLLAVVEAAESVIAGDEDTSMIGPERRAFALVDLRRTVAAYRAATTGEAAQ